jgi:hypothetical protein
MHPGLLAHLERNQIVVGESLANLNDKAHDILSGLSGIRRTPVQARELLGGRY